MGGITSKTPDTVVTDKNYECYLTTDSSKFSVLHNKQNNVFVNEAMINELFNSDLTSNESLVSCVQSLISKIFCVNEIINESFSKTFSFISKPKNLGDVCCIRLFNILMRNIKSSYLFDFNKIEELEGKEKKVNEIISTEELLRKEILIETISRENLSEIFMNILKSYYDSNTEKEKNIQITNTKIDISILYFYHFIDKDKRIILNKVNCEILISRILRVLFIVNSMKLKNKQQHILLCLFILKRILFYKKGLKKSFLDRGGYKIIYLTTYSENPLIVKESLNIIEILIFGNSITDEYLGTNSTELEYSKVDKEIFLSLTKLNFEKFILDIQKLISTKQEKDKEKVKDDEEENVRIKNVINLYCFLF